MTLPPGFVLESPSLGLDALGLDEQQKVIAQQAFNRASQSELTKVDPNYPALFVSKLFQESGLRPNAVGPENSGGRGSAKGLAQFIDSTSQEVGLSDPFDPVQAINKSVEYDEINAQRLGNKGVPVTIENVFAAYNAGAGNVAKHGGIPPFEQTQNYIKSINNHASKINKVADNTPKEVVQKTQDLSRNLPDGFVIENVPRETAQQRMGAGSVAQVDAQEALQQRFDPSSLSRREVRNLPEIGGEIKLGESPLTQGSTFLERLAAGAGSFFAFENDAQADIVAKQLGLESYPIENGNYIFRNPESGELAQLNRRGWSFQDVAPIIGGVGAFTPAGRVAATAATVPRALGVGAVASGVTDVALQGGEALLGSEQGFSPERLALTTAGGGLGEAVGRGILNRRIARSANTGSVRDAAALTEEFGVPLTRGEQTGLNNVIASEQAAVRGSQGPAAQNIAQQQLAQREELLADVINNTQRDLTGSPVTNTAEAGEAITRGLRDVQELERLKVSQAYEGLLDSDIEFIGTAFDGIGDTARNALNREGFSFVNPPGKATQSILNELDQVSNVPEGGIASLREVEMLRRRINNFSPENKSDAVAMRILKQEYDNVIDNAITDGLMSGNPQAVADLKQARELSRKFHQKFGNATGKGADAGAGKIIQSIVDKDADPAQTVNLIFGASQAGAKKQSVAAIRRLNSIFGKESEEMGAVRAAAFIRLLKDVNKQGPNGQVITKAKLKSNLSSAFSGNNKTVYEELFGKADAGKIKRLADLIIRTHPDVANPSGTASELIRQVINRGGAILSGGAGVGAGSLFGLDPVSAGVIGIGLFAGSQAKNAFKAKRLFNPVRQVEPSARDLLPLGAASGAALAE